MHGHQLADCYHWTPHVTPQAFANLSESLQLHNSISNASWLPNCKPYMRGRAYAYLGPDADMLHGLFFLKRALGYMTWRLCCTDAGLECWNMICMRTLLCTSTRDAAFVPPRRESTSSTNGTFKRSYRQYAAVYNLT